MGIIPNLTQMENPSLTTLDRPTCDNGLIGILVKIGVVIFLVVAVNCCNSSKQHRMDF